MEKRYVRFGGEENYTIVIGGGYYGLPGHAELSKTNRAKVTSAGFFEIKDGKVEVYGKSVGLGIGPSEGDAEAIQSFLGL